jgi:hypothetical protein
MIQLPIGYKVHTPLLSRLAELVQQRSIYDRPKLGWITRNYSDPAYLDRLLASAPTYGVTTLVFDGDGGDGWNEAADRVRAAGLEFEVLAREESAASVPDATAEDFGGGGLPYLMFDRLLQSCKALTEADQPIRVRIDQPGRGGETLATWGNVYAVSYHLLTGEDDSETILTDYAKRCFGSPADDLVRMFALARKAVEKSFFVFDRLPLMNGSRWPESLGWFDRQVERCVEPDHPLYHPSARTIADVDFEKIEALEAAHDAWAILEEISPRLEVNGFLWLEHYFLHLKVICTALRLLGTGYFKLRARNVGTMKIPDHIIRAIYKDLYNEVYDHRAVLTEFDAHAEAEGIDPLSGILADWRNLDAMR